MSAESDFFDVMNSDIPLKGILLGGIYQAALLGPDGITRAEVQTAFDPKGWLMPCALVKQRGRIPTSEVVDYEDQVVSTNQVVEIFIYEDSGYAQIDAAIARLMTLFFGKRIGGSWELYVSNLLDRERDQGALKGRSLGKMDWAVHSILSAA